jgi:peroxiredoxin/uncharacterized membrane protein YphA (DoxX/SURF4 family)
MLLLTLRLALAAVLVTAGIAKLVDVTASRKALADFGIPRAVAQWLGLFLPAVEIAVALTLLWSGTAVWGAAAALCLFLVFTGAIAYNLRRGHTPPCHCFGQLASTPISRTTLARTLLFAGVAAVALYRGPGLDIIDVVSTAAQADLFWIGSGAVGFALFGVQGSFIFLLLRQQGRLLIRVEGLEARLRTPEPSRSRPVLRVGISAPSFEGQDLDGRSTSLADFTGNGVPVVVFFTDPDCATCTSMLAEVGRWQQTFKGQLVIVVVSVGDALRNRDQTAAYGIGNVVLQRGHEVADLYNVVGTPTAIVIGSDGTVESEPLEGPVAIREWMTSVVSTTTAGEPTKTVRSSHAVRLRGPVRKPSASQLG